MKVGIIGCGYVLDQYMSTLQRHPEVQIAGVADIDKDRLRQVARYYNVRAYDSVDDLLADPQVAVIVNLMPTPTNEALTRSALLAGKHVYAEESVGTNLGQVREMFNLAAQRGLHLSCAPSNVFSATSLTMWKAVVDGAVGEVRIVYAEFDDNPIYLMSPEHWRSRSGAPRPYLHEYEMGATWDHVRYHLTWMCCIFGPVRSVTAFSKATIPDKTDHLLDPPDTPDFSVAVLDFASGVVGRVTCSIAAPLDHRMRIIGNVGMLHADTYQHHECPVYLERFTKLSLNARKSRSVRTRSWLQRPFGVGGHRLPLVKVPSSGERSIVVDEGHLLNPAAALRRWKQRELGQQDKMMGVAELIEAIQTGRQPLTTPEFIMHLMEVTLAIHEAGPDGTIHQLRTSFEPLELPVRARRAAPDYSQHARARMLARQAEGLLDRLHRH